MGDQIGKEDMEFLADIVGGFASGGITGIIGGILGAGVKFLTIREERAAKREEREYEKDMLKLQMQAKAAETEQELAIVSQEGSWSGLEASYRADAVATANAPSWANGVRALYRPLLTTLLIVMAGWMFFLLTQAFERGEGLFAAVFDQNEQAELIKYMVYSIFYTASTAALFWFADRAFTPPGMKNR